MKTQANTNLYISSVIVFDILLHVYVIVVDILIHVSVIVFDILLHVFVSIIDCICFPIS